MCRKFSFLVSFVLVLGLGVIAQAAQVDITCPGDAIKGIPDDGDWPAAEAPPFVIDDNPYTKFLHFKGDDQTSGFQVTPALNGLVVTGLSFTTGNDAPERDPVAFEIYGSNGTIDGPYTLIASGDIVDFDQPDPWPRNAITQRRLRLLILQRTLTIKSYSRSFGSPLMDVVCKSPRLSY